LGIKGINFSLKEFLFGMDSMKVGEQSSIEDSKPKLYNAMELDPELDSGQKFDKGKGIDKEAHPHYEDNKGVSTGVFGSESQSSDNGKGKEVASTSEPPFVT
jgi:hypothetical protein